MFNSQLDLMVVFGAVVLIGLVCMLVVKRAKRSKSSLSMPNREYSSSIRASSKREAVRRVASRQSKHPAQEAKFTGSETQEKPYQATPSQDNESHVVILLRRNLQLKALGNDKVVDRLIEFERIKHPTGNLVEWMNAAIRSWEDDHGRG
jgi:hypothetical protein